MQNSGNVPAAKIEVKNFGELENFQRKYFGSRGCIATRYENVSEWSLVVIKKLDDLESKYTLDVFCPELLVSF